MKPQIELPIDHYESLLKYASGASPLYARVKNAVKTEANTVAILCEIDEAEMLRDVAKHLCRSAVPEIERALKLALIPDSSETKTFLRDHPLLTYRGVHSWPPAWAWTDGPEKTNPQGEIGILREVLPSHIQPADRCFLYIDYEESTYVGCLMIDDHAFCDQVVKLLQAHCNCPIADIGSLDVTFTL